MSTTAACALREKMARLGLDCLIVGSAPLLQSYGGSVQWLTGHRDWHALVVYVVPLTGEPALIYPMGGTHIEATRRAVAIRDVRSSRQGHFMEVAAERIYDLDLSHGRIGLPYVDSQSTNYLQYRALSDTLPDATLVRVGDFFHELLYLKSPEEQAHVCRAGELCACAIEAMVQAARPGVTEYQLKASAARAIMEGDGQIDFLITGSTPMANPAQVFGNPRPSHRTLREGDIILNELAASYQGYTAQIGVPVCVGEPTDDVRRFFDDVVLSGFLAMQAQVKPGNDLDNIRAAGEYFRAHGAQSRPVLAHDIDFVTN